MIDAYNNRDLCERNGFNPNESDKFKHCVIGCLSTRSQTNPGLGLIFSTGLEIFHEISVAFGGKKDKTLEERVEKVVSQDTIDDFKATMDGSIKSGDYTKTCEEICNKHGVPK